MATTTLQVRGMTCGHCTDAVSRVLKGVPGVRSAEVDLEGGRARVDYDEGLTRPEALSAAVAGAGFTAEPVSG
ncbi:MAG: heavy-metal-associated domain-containing protein [Gemmatimonadota bacterium]